MGNFVDMLNKQWNEADKTFSKTPTASEKKEIRTEKAGSDKEAITQITVAITEQTDDKGNSVEIGPFNIKPSEPLKVSDIETHVIKSIPNIDKFSGEVKINLHWKERNNEKIVIMLKLIVKNGTIEYKEKIQSGTGNTYADLKITNLKEYIQNIGVKLDAQI